MMICCCAAWHEIQYAFICYLFLFHLSPNLQSIRLPYICEKVAGVGSHNRRSGFQTRHNQGSEMKFLPMLFSASMSTSFQSDILTIHHRSHCPPCLPFWRINGTENSFNAKLYRGDVAAGPGSGLGLSQVVLHLVPSVRNTVFDTLPGLHYTLLAKV